MKKVMLVLVLIALLVGAMPVSAHGKQKSQYVQITAINDDINWIQVEICFMLYCYPQWYAVTDSTKIHVFGNLGDAGFEDLEVGQVVFVEWYSDDGLAVASHIYLMNLVR